MSVWHDRNGDPVTRPPAGYGPIADERPEGTDWCPLCRSFQRTRRDGTMVIHGPVEQRCGGSGQSDPTMYLIAVPGAVYHARGRVSADAVAATSRRVAGPARVRVWRRAR